MVPEEGGRVCRSDEQEKQSSREFLLPLLPTSPLLNHICTASTLGKNDPLQNQRGRFITLMQVSEFWEPEFIYTSGLKPSDIFYAAQHFFYRKHWKLIRLSLNSVPTEQYRMEFFSSESCSVWLTGSTGPSRIQYLFLQLTSWVHVKISFFLMIYRHLIVNILISKYRTD